MLMPGVLGSAGMGALADTALVVVRVAAGPLACARHRRSEGPHGASHNINNTPRGFLKRSSDGFRCGARSQLRKVLFEVGVHVVSFNTLFDFPTSMTATIYMCIYIQ